ncbi:MAG: integration host factor subunit alpha [Desulfobacterales bacterium]|nr:integration host factor subunit alpha [Desulfobacterales bacterium]
MALTKADLVEAVMQTSGLTKAQCVDIVDSILSIVKDRLAAGEDVLISGFGKFQIQDKDARRGRNPATGSDLMLRPRKVVTFKYSGKLKKMVNGG